MKIAIWGIQPLVVLGIVVTLATWATPAPGRWIVFALGLGLWLFTLNFFRHPRREPIGGPHELVSPADGVVADIERIESAPWIAGPALRIGVFMSVFDVHVNRSPVRGQIAFAEYRPGRFLDARHPSVSHENEANTIGIEVDPAVATGVRLLVRQLSGLFARRIICTHNVGESLERGEVFGMIRFGSRVELWVPEGAGQVLVQVGNRVHAGETVLVRLTPAPPAPAATVASSAPVGATSAEAAV